MTKPSNPKRTGGPRTIEGKQMTSANALKTGAFSSMVVLPGESAKDFQRLAEEVAQDWQVVGITESAMAYELAGIMWKQMRLANLEHRVVIDHLSRPLTIQEFREVGLNISIVALGLIKTGQALDANSYANFSAILQEVEGYLKERKFSGIDLQEIKEESPGVYGFVVEMAKNRGVLDPQPEHIGNLIVKTDDSNNVSLLSLLYEDTRRELRALLWASDHQNEIKEAIIKIKDQRLVGVLGHEKITKASESLSRAFYRAVAELRKQQESRRKNEVIDVLPSEVKSKQNV